LNVERILTLAVPEAQDVFRVDRISICPGVKRANSPLPHIACSFEHLLTLGIVRDGE
jgi:hypothetical protein